MNRFPRTVAVAVVMAYTLSGCVVAPPVARPTLPEAAAAPPPMYFYPERGQDEARQERDRYECYRWAVGQSGFDPGMTPVTLQPQMPPVPVPRDGSAVAAGAMAGAVIGSVTSSRHSSGGATVIGAIFGAALGAMAQESRAQAAEQVNAARGQSNQAARQAALAPLDGFRRAMSACMLGRGYRVG
jgi:hypothetical protein